ncbi:LysM peptidoglycan-binding domain-containing protein [Kitasatospora sp. NBC_01250]|uniref:LysM peptidoglycan-binding domain-containing protein n=1 Tax=Kitasatospora sp. NBC_01250 TaxID=2903571 RepID=UPI002E313BBD|nr:LysM peptidoglycan-binding domain-containing protein [Kitasatospora sp. NBC_01250]
MLSVNGRPSLPSRAAIKRAIATAVIVGAGAGLPMITAGGASATPIHSGSHGYTAQHESAAAAPAAAPAAQAPAGYTVQDGDWLSKIATSHNVQGGWQKLYDLNKSVLADGPDVIYPGQHLALGDAQAQAPAQTPAPAQAPATAPAPAAPAAPAAAAAPATPALSANASVASLQALAASIVPADQLASFDQIITHESGWNVTATNPSSGAYGLPQALPGNKMASAGSDWATNPATQIKWALQYMNQTYGSPNQAWVFWQAHQAY